jgi:hypothetical protein
MVDYFNDVFDTPVEYLKDLFEDEPFDFDVSDDQENDVLFILNSLSDYLAEQ